MPGLKELTTPRVLATLERSRALHAQLVGDRLIQKIRNEQ